MYRYVCFFSNGRFGKTAFRIMFFREGASNIIKFRHSGFWFFSSSSKYPSQKNQCGGGLTQGWVDAGLGIGMCWGGGDSFN